MRPILITFLACAALACKSAREIRTTAGSRDSAISGQRALLKQYALCECLRQAFRENETMKDDVSLSIYYDQLLYEEDAIRKIDSLSESFAKNIKSYNNEDYPGKKPILYSCMKYYSGHPLDSLVKTLDRTIMK